MREKKYADLDIFSKEPSLEKLNEIWSQKKALIEGRYTTQIATLKGITDLHSKRYKETKSQEDWNHFTKARGELAGKTSGLKRVLVQQKKVFFIMHVLGLHDIRASYTLIQFIAKFLDGSGFDKETVLELRKEYKDDKNNYQIDPENLRMWKAIQVIYYKFVLPKNQTVKKVSKI